MDQPGRLLLKLIARCLFPRNPQCCWLGVGLWRPLQCPTDVQGVVRVSPVGSLSCQLVTLQKERFSEVQNGNLAKPPSCQIKGSWCSQGCTVVMLWEGSCWPPPLVCLKSAHNNTASLIFHRDLGGPSRQRSSLKGSGSSPDPCGEAGRWGDGEMGRGVALCCAGLQRHLSRILSYEIETSPFSHGSKVHHSSCR